MALGHQVLQELSSLDRPNHPSNEFLELVPWQPLLWLASVLCPGVSSDSFLSILVVKMTVSWSALQNHVVKTQHYSKWLEEPDVSRSLGPGRFVFPIVKLWIQTNRGFSRWRMWMAVVHWARRRLASTSADRSARRKRCNKDVEFSRGCEEMWRQPSNFRMPALKELCLWPCNVREARNLSTPIPGQTLIPYGGFLSPKSVPPFISSISRNFPKKNQPAIGDPPWRAGSPCGPRKSPKNWPR